MYLDLIGKRIDLSASRLLFDTPINSQNFSRLCHVYGGEWRVNGDWLEGKNPLNAPGMLFLKGDFPGNVIVDIEARTVLPSRHDIDVMWNGCWDEINNARGAAYVAGLQGWWEGKVGIEKSPEYKLVAGTPLFPFEPGRVYHLQAGSIEGHCFVFVDGRLLLEVTDPAPIDHQKYTKVGFEAYASHIQISKIKVWGIAWQPRSLSYAAEFA
jgi:hypothetical protein